MDRIQAAITAIESRELGESFSYRKVAEDHGVVRSTLTRAHRRAIGDEQAPPNTNKNLSDQEEIELLQYIKTLTERGLPPTRQMIQSFASTIARKHVSMSWVDRFSVRNKETLISRWTVGIDRNRHAANSPYKYGLYFDLLRDIKAKYLIEDRDTFNMDEKGFMIGILSRSKRIFNRPLWEAHALRQAIQDGNRDWVSLIACICADGSAIDPALIYPSTVGNIQDTWVEDMDPDQYPAFITSSESGWSNNEIGLAWLEHVFDRQTKHRCGRWRLLIVDGHGSHLTMAFIDYCDRNRILLLIYPPHATQTLQPLDVSVFKPLSTAYSNELSAFLHASQGLSSIAMRDFYLLFQRAWSNTMRPELILSAFEATGISPLNPARVLDRFGQSTPSDQGTPDSDTSILSASDWRKINRRLRALVDVSADYRAQQLSQTIHHISIQNQLLQDENKGLREALTTKKRKAKRGRPLPLDRSDSYHGGAVFWSPRSVQRARDRQHQLDQEKEQKQRQKAIQTEARKASQLLKARLAKERSIARIAAQEAAAQRRADEAKQKHLNQQARRAQQQHQKRLKIARSARKVPSTPRKQQKTRTNTPSRAVEVVGAASPASTPSTRRGRLIKTPSRYR